MMNLKFLKKSDIVLIVLLLVVCSVLLLPKYFGKAESGLTAVIMVDGAVVDRVALSDVTSAYEYTVPCESPVKLYISSDGVRFAYSECPDKVCINTGLLTRAGDTAACVPNKVIVILEGAKDSGAPDVITY
ncbi:MAG: NusG domain II-containing protein [Clostridia bacterium]|nr:NusG domain II-containing protein [Clostridia bacterium]MBR5991949.1 NusG domain II-containing protein [Clostridia bacterium]MBR6479789.1 NusG domain II-containing protein [Clostridia bacterium]MBR6512742.1 NusG domain II-containing protein [Clostridia bacterium]